jgi:hypothetical protein
VSTAYEQVMTDTPEIAGEPIMEYVRRVTRHGMTVISAKHGNEDARQQLLSRDRFEFAFPGSRDRAMGGALAVVEKLEEASIEAEREYVEEVGDYHRIDIVIIGDDEMNSD